MTSFYTRVVSPASSAKSARRFDRADLLTHGCVSGEDLSGSGSHPVPLHPSQGLKNFLPLSV